MSSTPPEYSNEIKQPMNFCKYFFMNLGPCATALFTVFKWFYNWKEDPSVPIDDRPSFLSTHLREVPRYGIDVVDKKGKTRNNKLDYYFKSNEIKKIKDMKKDKTVMSSYDVPFYCKLIQFGTNSEHLIFPGEDVWTEDYKPEFKDAPEPLEYLLLLTRAGRNDVGHKVPSLCNIDDDHLKILCQSLCDRMKSIIKLAGGKCGKTDEEIENTYTKITNEIQELRTQVDYIDRMKVLKYLKENDIQQYLGSLKQSFEKELLGFVPPIFISKDKEIATEDLLVEIDADVIVISAEYGCGKTSFSKYIQYEWLMKRNEFITGIFDYQVFQFSSRNINSQNVHQFFEDRYPVCRQMMSTTSNMEKEIDSSKILWFVEGFDEFTEDDRSFLEIFVSERIGENHKVIITTRPDCVGDLKKILKPRDVTTIAIKNFEKPQIFQVSRAYLQLSDNSKFEAFYDDLNDDLKMIVGIPTNLAVFLHLWKDGKLTQRINTNSQLLYNRFFHHERLSLARRLEDRTNTVKVEYLKIQILKWFKDYLCRIAAEVDPDNLILSPDLQRELINSASLCGLTGTSYLSTFFYTHESSSDDIIYCFKSYAQKHQLAKTYLNNCRILKDS